MEDEREKDKCLQQLLPPTPRAWVCDQMQDEWSSKQYEAAPSLLSFFMLLLMQLFLILLASRPYFPSFLKKTHTSITLVRIQRLVTTLSGRAAKVLWKTCAPLELCSSPSRFLLLRHRNHSNQTTPDTITACFWEQRRKRERSHLEHMASMCPQLCLYWQYSRSQTSHSFVLGKAEVHYKVEQPRPAAFLATLF